LQITHLANGNRQLSRFRTNDRQVWVRSGDDLDAAHADTTTVFTGFAALHGVRKRQCRLFLSNAGWTNE
jgi:hypothetical protein